MTKINAQQAHPSYRADIDGLRAVAVLAVVGFHVAPGRIAGGFIGVDIFFVISGYLISTIIFTNLEQGNRFSITDFYSRRIRRIFPSLATVMLASLLIGWWTMTADEYTQLAKHVVGGASFVSNFVLYGESGYFDTAAHAKPMLHLWSLAIEEQFYIFWPLLLAFVWNRRWSFLRVTATVAVLSFAANLWLVHRNPAAAFYWPISRVWELMIGGTLAYLALHKPTLLRRYTNVQSLVGVALLAIGLWSINNTRAFPGLWALLPAMSSFLIISAGPDAWFNKHVLSRRVMVWAGLISYPLYLWHWPLLSLARIFNSGEISGKLRIVIVAISLAASWLTYRIIETPCRRAQFPYSHRKVLLLVCVMLFTAGLGIVFYRSTEALRPAGPSVVHAGDLGNEEFLKNMTRFPPCSIVSPDSQDTGRSAFAECQQSFRRGQIEVAVMGDSHAAPLFMGIADSLKGVNTAVFSGDDAPFTNRKEFEGIYKYVLSQDSIHTVILVAHWSGRLGPAYSQARLVEELTNTITALELRGKNVFITNDNPDFSFAPRRCKYQGRFGQTNICSQDVQLLHTQLEHYQPAFESVASRHPRMKVLHTAEFFCDERRCSMENAGLLLFRDNQHLNINGALLLGKFLQKELPHLASQPMVGQKSESK